MAPKAALAVVLMLCCASVAFATYNKCYHDGDCKADNQCVYGVCDYGKCIYKHKNDGTSCSLGKPCIVGDYCYKGDCKVGKPVVCKQPKNTCEQCTCNPNDGPKAQCKTTKKPAGSKCDDGSKCTEHDKCNSYGVCKGSPKYCPNKGQCTKVYCDAHTGQCKNPWVPNGTKCNDGNHKTEHDKCNNGVCKGQPIYYG